MTRAREERRSAVRLAALLLWTAAWGDALAAQEAARARPNVLLVVADDLNTAISSYGTESVRTPSLDRLAARGGALRPRVLATTPSATRPARRCSPAATPSPPACTPTRPTRANGCRTPCSCRSTSGDRATSPPPWARSRTTGSRTRSAATASSASPESWEKRRPPTAAEDDGFRWQAVDDAREEADEVLARRAVEVLEQRPAKPFFLAVGFHRPHVPHVAPRAYFDRHPPEAMELFDRGGADGVPAIARDGFHPDWSDERQREVISHYAAATSFMDAQVGVLLDALDRLELAESTIVVFWSDHGWHLGDHGGLWAKDTLMEGAARVPLIVSAPGKATGVCAEVVESVDVYPTLAELCGLPAPPDVEGKSFAFALDAPGSAPGRTAYTVTVRDGELCRSIRDARYMYASYADGSEQLYDLGHDPHELHNVAADASRAESLAHMKRVLRLQLDRIGEPVLPVTTTSRSRSEWVRRRLEKR